MIELSPLKLPVRTESGQSLGQVVDVTIDPSTQGVMSYHVKLSRLVPSVVRSPLIIHQSQVVSITGQEMVVTDAAVRQSTPSAAPQPTA